MKVGFGAALEALIRERGFDSHRALARAAGVSQAQISRVVREQRLNITAETYFALSRALGVPCTYFEPWLDLPEAPITGSGQGPISPPVADAPPASAKPPKRKPGPTGEPSAGGTELEQNTKRARKPRGG